MKLIKGDKQPAPTGFDRIAAATDGPQTDWAGVSIPINDTPMTPTRIWFAWHSVSGNPFKIVPKP